MNYFDITQTINLNGNCVRNTNAPVEEGKPLCLYVRVNVCFFLLYRFFLLLSDHFLMFRWFILILILKMCLRP